MLNSYFDEKNVVNPFKEHKSYVSFSCGRSYPYGSRHNTESWLSDPNGSLALIRRRIYDPSGSEIWIYDPSGSVGKL